MAQLYDIIIEWQKIIYVNMYMHMYIIVGKNWATKQIYIDSYTSMYVFFYLAIIYLSIYLSKYTKK